MRCPRCGKENENAPFCEVCGDELSGSSARVSGNYMPAHPHDVRVSRVPVYQTDNTERRYQRYHAGPARPWGIAVIVAMTVLFAVLGLALNSADAFFLWGARSSSAYPSLVTPLIAVSVAAILVDAASIAAAYGLWKLLGWGWVLAVFLDLAGILLGIPALVLIERTAGQSGTLLPGVIGADALLALAILFYLFQNRVMLLYE